MRIFRLMYKVVCVFFKFILVDILLVILKFVGGLNYICKYVLLFWVYDICIILYNLDMMGFMI